MAITAQEVNKLRKSTGAGMMDCKKALTEAEGDFDAAVEILRKKGQKVSAKRADRETKEGTVALRTNEAGSKGYIVALSCETDFVAKNDEFVGLANQLADLVAANDINSSDDLNAAQFTDGRTVAENMVDYIGKIGEKIEASVETIEATSVVPYLHSNSKLGVLVGLSSAGQEDAGKDVAMQIAAMNPVALNKDEVPSEVVEKELALGRELALQEGKPEQIVDKIAQGKLQKYFKENTLLEQVFVKDSSVTISQMLNNIESGLTVTSFKRLAIG